MMMAESREQGEGDAMKYTLVSLPNIDPMNYTIF